MTALVVGVNGKTVGEIFGSPDDLKFHSSVTLFAQAGEGETIFSEALGKFFDGALDRGTVALI